MPSFNPRVWLTARLRRFLRPTIWQTPMLFTINMVSSGLDYAFHFYLGWALLPPDFAMVQTVNSALLVVVTVFGMTQPVVARFVVANPDNGAEGRAVFQNFFWQSAGLGLMLTLLVGLGSGWIGHGLNVRPLAVVITSGMVGLALIGPVALVAVSFGGKYASAAALLGWMGVAMMGHGLATMWLNFFLATRPRFKPFSSGNGAIPCWSSRLSSA